MANFTLFSSILVVLLLHLLISTSVSQESGRGDRVSITDMLESIKVLQEQQKTDKQNIALLLSQLASLETEFNSQKTELNSQRTELNTQKTELASQRTELSSIKTELASQKAELISQKSENAKIRQELEKVKSGQRGSYAPAPTAHDALPGLVTHVGVLQRTMGEVQNLQKSEQTRLNSAFTQIGQIKVRKVPVSGSGGPPPIGFVYFQLPAQMEPLDLWSGTVWKDVSYAYSGVFFRVVGNGSLGFGRGVQAENAPRLVNVTFVRDNGYAWYDYRPGSCAKVVSGQTGSGAWLSTKYCLSEGEVRPKNMAFKVWKRKA